MATPKAGDRVRVLAREMTGEDVKTGLYYSYFAGLAGTVDRVYDDGSVCVDVDLESLGEEIRARHAAMQEAERTRWLENLSDEGRGRLAPEQKELKMSYRILVSKKDIEPAKGGKPGPAPPGKPKEAQAASPRAAPQAAKPPPEASKPAPAKRAEAEPQPKRLSEEDLSAAEEAFLRSRQKSA